MSKYGLKNLGVKAGPVFTVLYYFEGPGVIIELGYLTNEHDYNYLTSKNAKKEMATAITDAIISYFKALDGNGAGDTAETVVESGSKVDEKPAEKSQQGADEILAEGYTIQVMSSMSSVDVASSQFKGYKGRVQEFIGEGAYKYKYCYGRYSTLAEAKSALQEVKATFKDAYVVSFRGNNIVKK